MIVVGEDAEAVEWATALGREGRMEFAYGSRNFKMKRSSWCGINDANGIRISLRRRPNSKIDSMFSLTDRVSRSECD